MAPVNQLSVLAFASAVLAVPHAQGPFKRHAHAHASAPAYGASSSVADPFSSAPPAYGSSSADPWSSSAIAYPSASSSYVSPVSSSGAPVPSGSGFPECWATCFAENGNPSEEELCGNEAVSDCICETCDDGNDKTYKGWLADFCAAGPSSSVVSPVSSSAYPSYPVGSSSYVSPVSSSAPIPSGSGFPECWSECFSENGNPSEAELCGNDAVSKCIHDTCSPAEDKAYWTWYDSYCAAPSSSAGPISSGAPYPYPSGSSSYGYPTGGYGTGGFPSYSTCTETSTLIYRSTTAYSTYYVTHTIYKSDAASSAAPASGVPGGYPAGSAPAYNAVPASSADPAGYSAPASPAGGESCALDVTVTTTVKTTVYITPAGPDGGIPTSAAPISKEAAPSYPAGAPSYGGASSWGAASSAAAPSYPAAPSSAPVYSSAGPEPSSPAAGPYSKRGIAYNDVSLANSLAGGAASGWAYNWISSSGGLDSSIPYIPTLHDASSTFTSTWAADAQAGIDSGAQYLFSFNEPDMSTQANLSPDAAAAAWKQYMEPFAGKVKLVAPAVTNGQGDGVGLSWLTSFLSACSDCTIDAVAMHWYYAGNPIDEFKSQIQAVADATGKGVWLNEFGADGTDEDKTAFLGETLPWLEGNGSILGYSYFMVADGSLMDGTSPSSWGAAYCN